MTQFFYSSDHTEFSRRFPAEAITHRLTQRRPVRSIQIPLGLEYVPQISQIYTDFFHLDFSSEFLSRRFRRWRRFFCSSDHTKFSRRFPAEAITHGLTRRRPVRSIQIPLGLGKAIRQRFHKKSVKSVGQKTIAAHIGRRPEAKYPRKSVSNPISKNDFRFIREIRWRKCPTDFANNADFLSHKDLC